MSRRLGPRQQGEQQRTRTGILQTADFTNRVRPARCLFGPGQHTHHGGNADTWPPEPPEHFQRVLDQPRLVGAADRLKQKGNRVLGFPSQLVLSRADLAPFLGRKHLHPGPKPPPSSTVCFNRIFHLTNRLALRRVRGHRQNLVESRGRFIELPGLLQFPRIGQTCRTLARLFGRHAFGQRITSRLQLRGERLPVGESGGPSRASSVGLVQQGLGVRQPGGRPVEILAAKKLRGFP